MALCRWVDAGEERTGRTGSVADLKPNLAGGRQRVEHAGDDLTGARPARLVFQFGLEEFPVGQDDPELIVQAMKEQPEIWRLAGRGSGSHVGGRHHEASLLVR